MNLCRVQWLSRVLSIVLLLFFIGSKYHLVLLVLSKRSGSFGKNE